jgi:acetyltransferase-like isoleucine patch superfamily enzyme
MLKRFIKYVVLGSFLLLACPLALACAFGRLRELYMFFAQSCALVPGLPGDYLRIAFYKLTLADCSLSSRISFGSFFSNAGARLGAEVFIGPYSILGMVDIGERTQIASAVQVLSGARQHARGDSGEITGADRGEFSRVSIGADCWIGAAAIVMNDVGAKCTIGAGSVVTKPIPPGSVAVGSPARVIKSTE